MKNFVLLVLSFILVGCATTQTTVYDMNAQNQRIQENQAKFESAMVF